MKEHKMQIIAALALAFSLGLVAPSLTYASEGTEDEGIALQAEGSEDAQAEGDVEAQAEGDVAGGTNKEDVISQDVADNIVELYSRIRKNDSFKGYRDAEDLVSTTVYVEGTLLQTAENWAKHVNSSDTTGTTVWAWNALSEATKAAVEDKTIYEAIDSLKEDALYNSSTAFKKALDNMAALVTSNTATMKTEVKALLTEVTDVDDMDLAELVKTAKTLPDFEKYVNLYEALLTIAGAVDGTTDTVVSATKLKATWTDAELMVRYNAIAKAAVAIDADVMKGLMDWKMPNTSAGVDAPDTGIVGLIESGALDLGTITLIVSVALAGVAGLGLIAKLYLKHKF